MANDFPYANIQWDLLGVDRRNMDLAILNELAKNWDRAKDPVYQNKKGSKVKLRLTNYDWKESYKDVMFNPEQFGDTKSVNYGTINAPMQSYPRHVYQGGDVTTLNNIELYYNHNSPARVREMVLWLQDFLPSSQGGVTVAVPPTILFSWGYWYTKRCILKSLSTDYTMFNEDLQPTECKITLDLEVVPIGTDPWTPQPWEVLR